MGNGIVLAVLYNERSSIIDLTVRSMIAMPNTYEGVLHDNRIEWSGAPPDLKPDRAVRVRVTFLDRPPSDSVISQGDRMVAALERLAAHNGWQALPDGVTWEREMRQDRPLPGRDV
jgi:hypothetical protein